MMEEERRLKALGWTEDCPSRECANFSHPVKKVLLSFYWKTMKWHCSWNRNDIEYHWDKRTNYNTLFVKFK